MDVSQLVVYSRAGGWTEEVEGIQEMLQKYTRASKTRPLDVQLEWEEDEP